MRIDVDAAIAVRVSDRQEVAVNLRGRPSEVQAVELVQEAGGPVTLLSREPTARRHRLEIAVDVPLGCAVILRRSSGSVAIGDTHGAVDLELGDGACAQVGAVTDLKLRASGNGSATIERVRADRVSIDIFGAGRVRVAGDARRLEGRVFGSGNLCVLGSAEDADLTVHGSGIITITRVKRRLLRTCLGSGNAVVAIPPALDAYELEEADAAAAVNLLAASHLPLAWPDQPVL